MRAHTFRTLLVATALISASTSLVACAAGATADATASELASAAKHSVDIDEGQLTHIARGKSTALDVEREAAFHGQGYGYVILETQPDDPREDLFVQFDFEGGLDHAKLAPGAHLRFGDGVSAAVDEPLNVTVTAKSRHASQDWESKNIATSVDIRVEEGAHPGSLRVLSSALFQNKERIDAVFDYSVR